ncbi:MAG: ATP-binding protein [Hyphomicrobium sp.]|jgi:SpoVK/Ycf46/Vps4 family AAA+-type ATPase|uniref:AAA family ATPase n=1 Tax=Hyphomicrobium sp. DMF-1 TaxID=3019544 RepID=UPI000BD4148B|nr:ATP-binding protein [Hyphomicrobium sp. DMF-1]OYW53680.1 MAG: AAA family ATPase [Hyphomicrobium sp. 12-62-95]OYX98414.1 MAG: AAA family ATPase [Hyphomicrobium sp. 32-62-53]WBT37930.1 ATP-binding protein [Hyphomicrobium sp. DMF-1]
MAKADQIKRLIGSYGRPSEFRAAALKIIEEEQRKGHMPLAASLKRVLDASVQVEEGSKRGLTALSNVPESAVDLVEILEPTRSLKQVVLFAEARSAIERVLEEQRRGDELRQHRLPVRSKVLLHGPPGCGKTLTAEVLARELGLPLYVAKIDVIISSLLGQTASNLRRLFDFAGRSPCVLFLDEFDAVARARSDSSEHNELRRVVNSLLVMIDRHQPRGLLVAATNLHESLDSAIWRRFDEIVELDLPDNRQIEAMLHLQFRNYQTNFELGEQVSKLAGQSFADIERICLDAIKNAVMKRRKVVSETEFAAAVKHASKRRPSRPHK